jgi:dTDP-4-amino-4,6-dideoxygalactose transaminase
MYLEKSRPNQESRKAGIAKRAEAPGNFARHTISFHNARTAFKALLQELDFSCNGEVLLPAYVGWSPKEGSGVFDPVREVGVKFRFYRVNRDLTIDQDDAKLKIKTGNPKLMVIIHYFGYPDPQIDTIVDSAHARGVLILEDEAHALYSDWIGRVCGRLGDASIMSLHKMLPCPSGGLLILSDSLDKETAERLKHSSLREPLVCSPLDYDLAGISRARRRNAAALIELLKPMRDRVVPLYDQLPDGVVPQTFPVIVQSRSRDELYFDLNELGYGVVSLYHTLIEPIGRAEFPDSHWMSSRILNLPVHQDASLEAIEAMVTQLDSLL